MKTNLLDSFRKIYLDINNLSSYRNYYNALRLWVKKNSKYFDKEIQSQTRLKILLDLDLDKYLVSSPDLSLDMEKKRMDNIDLSSINIMLMIICDTLWDMVTIRSEKNCLNCGDGDFRYIKVNWDEHSDGKIILECSICGDVINVDGSEFNEKIECYYPACKKDIIQNLIEL